MDLIQSRFVCPLLFPFYCVIELNRGKKIRISYCKTLNGFPNILLAANKLLSSNFIKRAISCSPVSFLEQKCEANFMIVLFAVHFLKGSDPIGFLPFSPPWQSGVGFLYQTHALSTLSGCSGEGHRHRKRQIQRQRQREEDLSIRPMLLADRLAVVQRRVRRGARAQTNDSASFA